MLVLRRDEIQQCLPMKEAIEVVKRAFISLSSGEAVIPNRTHIDIPDRDGALLVMPGYLPGEGAITVKAVSIFPRNAGDGLSVIHGVVAAIDPNTGVPLALLEGAGLTALRTGAAAGAATDLLARPDASTVAIFGAGVQGRTQLEAVCTARSIETIYVFDPDDRAARDFAREMAGKMKRHVRVASSASEAASGADIICTATTSAVPVFEDRDIRPGTHINAMGVFKPDHREIPPETVRRARVFVDSREACIEEAGDLLIPLREGLIEESHIIAELGEVAAKVAGSASKSGGARPGRSELGRISPEDITLFKSVGVAIQDTAAAAAVLVRAKEQGLGAQVSLE